MAKSLQRARALKHLLIEVEVLESRWLLSGRGQVSPPTQPHPAAAIGAAVDVALSPRRAPVAGDSTNVQTSVPAAGLSAGANPKVTPAAAGQGLDAGRASHGPSTEPGGPNPAPADPSPPGSARANATNPGAGLAVGGPQGVAQTVLDDSTAPGLAVSDPGKAAAGGNPVDPAALARDASPDAVPPGQSRGNGKASAVGNAGPAAVGKEDLPSESDSPPALGVVAPGPSPNASLASAVTPVEPGRGNGNGQGQGQSQGPATESPSGHPVGPEQDGTPAPVSPGNASKNPGDEANPGPEPVQTTQDGNAGQGDGSAKNQNAGGQEDGGPGDPPPAQRGSAGKVDTTPTATARPSPPSPPGKALTDEGDGQQTPSSVRDGAPQQPASVAVVPASHSNGKAADVAQQADSEAEPSTAPAPSINGNGRGQAVGLSRLIQQVLENVASGRDPLSGPSDTTGQLSPASAPGGSTSRAVKSAEQGALASDSEGPPIGIPVAALNRLAGLPSPAVRDVIQGAVTASVLSAARDASTATLTSQTSDVTTGLSEHSDPAPAVVVAAPPSTLPVTSPQATSVGSVPSETSIQSRSISGDSGSGSDSAPTRVETARAAAPVDPGPHDTGVVSHQKLPILLISGVTEGLEGNGAGGLEHPAGAQAVLSSNGPGVVNQAGALVGQRGVGSGPDTPGAGTRLEAVGTVGPVPRLTRLLGGVRPESLPIDAEPAYPAIDRLADDLKGLLGLLGSAGDDALGWLSERELSEWVLMALAVAVTVEVARRELWHSESRPEETDDGPAGEPWLTWEGT